MARRKLLIPILGLAALAAILAPVIAHEGHNKVPQAEGSYDLNAPRTVSPQTARVIDLQIAEVDFGTVEQVIRLGGIVRAAPDRVQHVAATVAATITAVNVQLADEVKRGQTLIELSSPEFARLTGEIEKARAEHERLAANVIEARASLEQTRSQLGVVEEQAHIAESELERLVAGADAVNANVISQKRTQAVQARGQVTNLGMIISQLQSELASRSRQLEASEKAIAASQRVLQLARSPGVAADRPHEVAGDLGLIHLTAAIDGVVTRREAWPGQGAQPGDALLHLVDYSVVQIDGELPESLVDRLHASRGLEVRIRIESGRDIIATGRVLAISPTVNAVRRTAHLVIEADNPDRRLRDGMYVDLSVVISSAVDAVVVPAGALLNEGPMHFVFVEEDGVYHKHDVVPGARDDRFVEILDGVVPGDRVVTRGAFALTQLRGAGAAGADAAPASDDHGHSH